MATGLATAHGAEVLLIGDSAQIEAPVDDLLAQPERLVVVLAGDGTLRAMAGRLTAAADIPRLQLFVLGSGRTNLTGGELGGKGGVLAKLEAALQRWREGIPFRTEERHVLEIAQPPAPPRRGFFVSGGLIDHAIRACHRSRLSGSGALHQGAAGTTWALLKVALSDIAGSSSTRCSMNCASTCRIAKRCPARRGS